MWFEKPIEYYAALIGGAIYVYRKHKDEPALTRLAMVIMSVTIALAVVSDVMRWTGISEQFALLISTAIGYFALDFAQSLFSDREYLKEILKGRFSK